MSESGSGTPGRGASSPGDLRSSVSRLERAVDELVTTTRDQVSDRAAAVIEETTQRLERELDRRQARADRDTGRAGEPHGHRPRDRGREPAERRREHHRDHDVSDSADRVPRRLYRDPRRQKIGGVCAGIARYYGMEAWVVRCIAVTGLLFFPTIVFPAYWIAYFVMDKPPKANADPEPQPDGGRHGRRDHRSPAPELGPRFSPRYSLRNVKADLTEVELRLRRMESHVTSGRYELQRELHKIDGGNDGRGL